MNGNGSAGGEGAGDVARAEVCRKDEAREAWGLGGVVFPARGGGEEGAGGVALQDRASLSSALIACE